MKSQFGEKSHFKPGQRVFVMMSGGVDSSVAALILKNKGLDVVGVYIKGYNLDGCAERDSADARRVAEKIGVPFYVWDFEKEYKNKVVDYMIDGYKNGLTPNPDVMCNKEIKFGLFLEKALETGADFVATGHYVRRGFRIQNLAGRTKNKNSLNSKSYILYSAKDLNKDQSYFLWILTTDQIKHCLFPIGDFLKSEVREMAREAKLPTAEKKDSQGICFLGKITLKEFLGNYIPQKRGGVLNSAGKKIGEHNGAFFYTIGQRHGLNIPASKPYYIFEKNVKKNVIKVAEGNNHPALFQKEIELKNVNLIDPEDYKKAKKGIKVLARIRYRQPLFEAKLNLNSKAKLVFKNPQKFAAPGQAAVFYTPRGKCLGGGFIA